ncbi:MAG: radical SAM protein [Candidatus Gracilibacteria bacterium]|nr:radical SAM protein [Candidatus Gracilibacteria bacterium]MDD2908602.1 radical SAM protein [Candidatus Gracilibacteria bacterium]
MIKKDIIINMTRRCNYNCSYCNVIKDNSVFSKQNIEDIVNFLKFNSQYINTVKFFGGEPILVFDDIKHIIENTKDEIGNKFVIVTNAKILNDEIGEYFSKYFETIFFSIDTENDFNYEKVINFINQFSLNHKLYFNIVINPGEENNSLEQFTILKEYGINKYNILPVYYTKEWNKKNLLALSENIKNILNFNLDYYGFQQNEGYVSSLINESFFIDTDSKIYYSDIVSTYLGNPYKRHLFIGDIAESNLNDFINLDFGKYKKIIKVLENFVYNKSEGQKELHEIMDYFSVYLNNNGNDF